LRRGGGAAMEQEEASGPGGDPVRSSLASSIVVLLALSGCGGQNAPEPARPGPPGESAGESATDHVVGEDAWAVVGEPGERPLITAEECATRGGMVVGDIGDGATHSPDYRCPDGEPPIADVPLGVEGSVCCLRPS
jgi:hypothetical protein